jgi:hypothetical protein
MRFYIILFLQISAEQFSNRFQNFLRLKQLKEMKELGIPLREILIQNVISQGLPTTHSVIMNKKKIEKKKEEIAARPKLLTVELEPETFSVAETSFRASQSEYNADVISLVLYSDRELNQSVRYNEAFMILF